MARWFRSCVRRRKLNASVPASQVEVLDRRVVLFAGDLDATFGSGGTVVISTTGSEGNPVATSLLANGSILVVGETATSASGIAHQYTSSGVLDATFGPGGIVSVTVTNGGPVVDAVVLPDGKIVATGNGAAIYSARLTPGGTLDASYGNGLSGTPGVSAFLYPASVRQAALQSDGKLVAVGEGNNGDMFVARINTDGTIDTSFGTDGFTIFDIGPGRDTPNRIAIDTSGRIVVAGEAFVSVASTDKAVIVARFTTSGTLDNTFDADGKLLLQVNGDNRDVARGLNVDAAGKIVVVGSNSRAQLLVVRLNDIGTLDTAFNGTGYLETDIYASTASIDGTSVVRQADGKLLIAATVYDPNVSPITNGVALVRLTAAGAFDSTFSSDGQTLITYGSRTRFSSNAPEVVLQADGKVIVTTAVDSLTGNTVGNFAISRVETEGAPTPGITVGGIATTGMATTEAGGVTSFTLVLTTQPTADVTIPVSSSDATEGTLAISSVTFTAANWNIPKTITITGIDDAAIDGNIPYSIVLGAATSGDASYSGVNLADLAAVNFDDESARFFRAYNPNADYHFFTVNKGEFDNAVAHGYRDETNSQTGFAVVPTQVAGSTPIYRLYNLQTGRHYYTYNIAERDFLVGLVPPPATGPDTRTSGWRFETTEGYIFATQVTGTTEIFRLYNMNSGVHLYTQDAAYKNSILSTFPGIWSQHDSLGYAYAVATSGATAGFGAPASFFASVTTETPAAATSPADDTLVSTLIAAPSVVSSYAAAAATVTDTERSGGVATDEEPSEDESWWVLGAASTDLDPWSV
jgi:uncharacterized delta-60 repeat protein